MPQRPFFSRKQTCAQPIRIAKSDLYQNLLPALNSAKIDLLDHKRTVDQLILLERRTGRSGRDIIDHRIGGHDDCANAIAGAAHLAAKGPDHGWAAIVSRAFRSDIEG